MRRLVFLETEQRVLQRTRVAIFVPDALRPQTVVGHLQKHPSRWGKGVAVATLIIAAVAALGAVGWRAFGKPAIVGRGHHHQSHSRAGAKTVILVVPIRRGE
jgi:hypothetical protein